MKTSSKKAKGRVLQQWVAKKIAKALDVPYHSQDDLCPIKSRGMGQQGADVYITDPALWERFRYAIECKNTETISVYAYIEQAKKHATEGQPWMVVHKKNRHKPIVILDAEHFFTLYGCYLRYKP